VKAVELRVAPEVRRVGRGADKPLQARLRPGSAELCDQSCPDLSLYGLGSTLYAGRMSASYIMKVSGNGQVSIPAEARARWKADRVVVVDLGDRVVMRPLPEDPVGSLRGKYRDRMADSDAIRDTEAEADAADDQ
jgi:bifunctional DNA-binding transcriptional regulator/antitoxin component of YhaV-PrlF toxin-antitoxin module